MPQRCPLFTVLQELGPLASHLHGHHDPTAYLHCDQVLPTWYRCWMLTTKQKSGPSEWWDTAKTMGSRIPDEGKLISCRVLVSKNCSVCDRAVRLCKQYICKLGVWNEPFCGNEIWKPLTWKPSIEPNTLWFAEPEWNDHMDSAESSYASIEVLLVLFVWGGGVFAVI